jgi:hypothetical protein
LSNSLVEEEYHGINTNIVNQSSFTEQTNCVTGTCDKDAVKGGSEEVFNLEELWNSL